MGNYIWCEDSASGFQFWKVLFNTVFPNAVVESKQSNSKLSKAAERIREDGNTYYLIIDSAIDNPDVLRELGRLKRSVSGKTNVRIIKIHSFEFSLLSFEQLEDWVFAADDELKEKRKNLLEAKTVFVNLIINSGYANELAKFKALFDFQNKANSEKIAAELLWEITRNTGFETDKSQVGPCFINTCCEWSDRQDDDICGLDNERPTINEKMHQLIKHSVLRSAFKEAGLL